MTILQNVGRGNPINPWPPQFPPSLPLPEITRAEFDALKREMEELKKLLTAAKHYDKATAQPDCEQAEKVALIKAIAKAVGVSMDDVFSELD